MLQMNTSVAVPYNNIVSAGKICKEVESIYERLANLESLTPGKLVDELFTRLVELAMSDSHELVDFILNDLRIKAIQPNLHHLCSMGEYGLELHWVRQVLGNAQECLSDFPYYDNYQKLAQLEYHSIQAVNEGPIGQVLFVGSGPLPLSSILLAQEYGLVIDNMDLDEDACQLSESLILELNLENQLTVQHADVLTHTKMESYDLVYLAALVGQTHEDKEQIVKHISKHMKAGAILILRSSSKLKKLLYPPVDLSILSEFKVLTEVHPYNEIVNSLVIAQKI